MPVEVLLMKACTAMQDKIQSDFKDTPLLWSMCWMNFWCSLYNCAYLFVVTTAGWDLIVFCKEFPEVCSLLLICHAPRMPSLHHRQP